MYTLTATKRAASESVGVIRRRGSLPAVVYGPKQEAISVSLDRKVFEKILREAGESSVVELSGASPEPLQVLIHDVDHDPVTNVARHADFYAIEKGAKVEVAIPISYRGESPAVEAGANLVKVLHELEVRAGAAELPHEMNVDISVLANVGDKIHARDIVLPSGVELMTDPEEIIALVQEVEVEVEEPVVSADVDMAAIEVEKKGKAEEEGVAPAAAEETK